LNHSSSPSVVRVHACKCTSAHTHPACTRAYVRAHTPTHTHTHAHTHMHTCAHAQAQRLKEFHALHSRGQSPSTQQHIRAASIIFNGKGDEEVDGPMKIEVDKDWQRVEAAPRLTARFLAQRSLRETKTAQWLASNVSVADAI